MVQQHAMTKPTSTSDSMDVERWGSGPPIVFVHGGGAGGVANFQHQRPLAERWTMILPDRPGHGRTPPHGREDLETDAPPDRAFTGQWCPSRWAFLWWGRRALGSTTPS